MSYEMQKKSRDEEKVFSVTMTEEELSLFSEFLEQREEQKNYSKKEEREYFKRLRYEDPERYLDEIKRYRKDKRESKSALKGLTVGAALGAPLGGAASARDAYTFNRKVDDLFKSKRSRQKYYIDGYTAAAQGAGVGALSGAAIGLTAGILKSGVNNIKNPISKDIKDSLDVEYENRLKKEDPEEYKRLKDKQRDVVKVLEDKMTKKDFKRKYGHKPNTRI